MSPHAVRRRIPRPGNDTPATWRSSVRVDADLGEAPRKTSVWSVASGLSAARPAGRSFGRARSGGQSRVLRSGFRRAAWRSRASAPSRASTISSRPVASIPRSSCRNDASSAARAAGFSGWLHSRSRRIHRSPVFGRAVRTARRRNAGTAQRSSSHLGTTPMCHQEGHRDRYHRRNRPVSSKVAGQWQQGSRPGATRRDHDAVGGSPSAISCSAIPPTKARSLGRLSKARAMPRQAISETRTPRKPPNRRDWPSTRTWMTEAARDNDDERAPTRRFVPSLLFRHRVAGHRHELRRAATAPALGHAPARGAARAAALPALAIRARKAQRLDGRNTEAAQLLEPGKTAASR